MRVNVYVVDGDMLVCPVRPSLAVEGRPSVRLVLEEGMVERGVPDRLERLLNLPGVSVVATRLRDRHGHRVPGLVISAEEMGREVSVGAALRISDDPGTWSREDVIAAEAAESVRRWVGGGGHRASGSGHQDAGSGGSGSGGGVRLGVVGGVLDVMG